jgi:DNA polymerase-1
VIVYLDTETTGLDPRADRLVLVGAAVDDRQPRALAHPADRDLIQRYLNADATFVGHNIGFDMSFLEGAGYRIPAPARWEDTVLIAHVSGERLPGQTALARLTKKLIEAGELDEGILAPEAEIKRWLAAERRQAKKDGRACPEKGDAPARLLNPYLYADVVATRAVHAHYSASINGQGGVLELERRCLPAIYAVERRGVPLDLDAAAELRDRTEALVADLRARLFELAGHPFNLNAARQIETALVERDVDLSAVPRTPRAGMPMFTADTLALVDDELARVLLEYRAEKKLSDYVIGLWKHAHGDRLYGTFRQTGTDTGRMSSASPNLQNIPKSDLRVRYTIAAGPGKVLVGADLDSVELRVLASYAPGGALERALTEGADLHQQTGDAVGVSRDEGKTLNYAILYGAGAPRVASQLGCSADEARVILDRWYAAYPEVGRLKGKLTRTVRARGYITTIGGRRHYFPDGPNHRMLNRLVSGGCADLFKRSVVELHEAGVPVVLYVHDEVVAEVDVGQAEETGRLLEAALTRGAGQAGARITGLKAEAASAPRWSDFKQLGYVPDDRAREATP